MLAIQKSLTNMVIDHTGVVAEQRYQLITPDEANYSLKLHRLQQRVTNSPNTVNTLNRLDNGNLMYTAPFAGQSCLPQEPLARLPCFQIEITPTPAGAISTMHSHGLDRDITIHASARPTRDRDVYHMAVEILIQMRPAEAVIEIAL